METEVLRSTFGIVEEDYALSKSETIKKGAMAFLVTNGDLVEFSVTPS
jgi:hypothetical protein